MLNKGPVKQVWTCELDSGTKTMLGITFNFKETTKQSDIKQFIP